MMRMIRAVVLPRRSRLRLKRDSLGTAALAIKTGGTRRLIGGIIIDQVAAVCLGGGDRQAGQHVLWIFSARMSPRLPGSDRRSRACR